LGFPRNDNDIVYGKGYLSALTGFNGDSGTYQIQIGANPGNSGAPLFNNQAELIGVISTRQKQTEGVAFAVKASKIIEVIASLKEKEATKDLVIKLPKSNEVRNAARKSQLEHIKDYMYSIRSFN
jgi:S1-C subfamily serine protease